MGTSTAAFCSPVVSNHEQGPEHGALHEPVQRPCPPATTEQHGAGRQVAVQTQRVKHE